MGKDVDSTLVTVSVPMWNASDTVRRAVDSLLGQTITAMKVVVVNDGGPSEVWKPLQDIQDDRLVKVDLPINKGRYHADHVVLHKYCKSQWFAICDADDYVDPDWLETLLAHTPADVVLADHWVHPLRNNKPELSAVQGLDLNKTFRWRAHMAGLYRADWARQHHITNPFVRVGWDNVMTSIPFLIGDVKISRQAKYHRVRRADSLTTAKTTGIESPMRRMIVPELKAAWRQIVADPSSIQKVVNDMEVFASSMAEIIQDSSFNNAWVLPKTTAAELDARLWKLQPRTVLECGSGTSTLILARYAQRTGAKVVSLEHKGEFYQRTLMNLRRQGLRDAVDLRMAHLSGTPPWYSTVLPDGIDFVLIDGPPTGQGGRAATLPNILPHLADKWEVWLDDGDRDEEKEMVRSWMSTFGVKSRLHYFPHGMYELRPKAFGRPPSMDASDVVITLLCGGRPELLADTLGSLPKQLLRDAHLMVIHNGSDELTGKVLYDYASVIDATFTNADLLSIGDNCQIAAEYAAQSGFKYWLHLEDDWHYDTFDHDWLDTAKEALENPSIAQVRLRHIGQTVSTRHMVTGRRIQWTPERRWLVGEAALTNNPSLVRSVDAVKMWPANGEKEMQRKAFKAGMTKIAQLYPGAFHHSGDDQSLRSITKCAP